MLDIRRRVDDRFSYLVVVQVTELCEIASILLNQQLVRLLPINTSYESNVIYLVVALETALY